MHLAGPWCSSNFQELATIRTSARATTVDKVPSWTIEHSHSSISIISSSNNLQFKIVPMSSPSTSMILHRSSNNRSRYNPIHILRYDPRLRNPIPVPPPVKQLLLLLLLPLPRPPPSHPTHHLPSSNRLCNLSDPIEHCTNNTVAR